MIRRRTHKRPAIRWVLTSAAGLVLMVLIGLFVWPTPYTFGQVAIGGSVYRVRVHRVSGAAEMFRTWGWEQIDATATAAATLADLPEEHLALLSGTPRIEWGSLQYDIHNQSPWTVWELTTVLTVRNGFGSVVRTREYTLRNSTSSVRCGPDATATFFARLGFMLQPDETWTARVVGARGTR